MIQKILRRFMSLALSAVLVVTLLPVISTPALAADVELSGLSNPYIRASYSGDEGKWDVKDGNSITGSVKSKEIGCSTYNYNTTLTLANNRTTAATLSFNYDVTLSGGTVTVAGERVSADGSYKDTLEPGGSIEISLKSGDINNDTKIEITNLSLFSDTSATVTFQPAKNGSYTVDGTPITADTAYTNTSAKAYSLAATPDSGYKFLDWYSDTAGSLGTSPSTSLNFDSDQTVTARFISDATPIFRNDGRAFTDLNEACASAERGSDKRVLLISDGTLPEGEYTIPAGVTLLIPFDEQGTCYTTEPVVEYAAHATPFPFRTLTMAPGAVLNVAGTVSVSSKLVVQGQNTSSWNGTPSGPYGCISMLEGSSMILEDGAQLCAYGYVSGDGSVLAKDGSTVYECFQLRDWRGGRATCGGIIPTKLNDVLTENRVFPQNQYYIQNVEAPLTFESGAKEIVWAGANVSSMSLSTSTTYIGDDGLFQLGEGSKLTKRYDGVTDRMIYDVEGDTAMSSFVLSFGALGVEITLNTADFVLPITNNFTINIHSGITTLEQDIALLPGTEITVDPDATIKIPSGHNVYVYDKDQWGNYMGGAQMNPVGYSTVNGTKAVRTAASLRDSVVDINGAFDVQGGFYTTRSGADIISSQGSGKIVFASGAGTETYTYQVTQSNTTLTAVEIPITSAMLHNGDLYAGTDEEFTKTDGAEADTTYQYCTNCDKWYTGTHTVVTFVVDGEEQASKTCTSNSKVTYDSLAEEPVAVTITGADESVLTGADSSWADGTLTVTGLSGATATVTIATTSVAEIVSSDGAVIDEYATLADAVEAYSVGNGYIQLTADVTESVTMNKNVYLDLNGHTVSAVNIDGGTLYGMDSSSDGYVEPSGSITAVTGGTPELVVETTDFKSSDEYAFFRYLAIQDENGWSFHRFNISVTGYRFELATNTPECALFFIAQFRGDELVRNQLKKIEITMTEGGKPITGPSIEFADSAENDERLHPTEDGFQFEAYVIRAFSGENASRYKTPYKASATVTFKNNGTLNSKEQTLTYEEAWTDPKNGLSEEDQARIQDLLAQLATT